MLHQAQPEDVNRRKVIKMAIIGTMMIAAPSICTSSRTTPKRIVIRHEGGIFTQVYEEVLYKPFTQATGIEVVGVTSEPAPTTQIQTMVKTKQYLWDMAALAHRDIFFLTTGNNVYLEKHELEHDPVISSIMKQFISPYGIGTDVFAALLAYRTDILQGRQPETWQDVWNIDHFPSRLGLPKLPFYTIEIALMADGVTPSSVYPCDLDRAFRSLDKIKPHVANWYTSGPQAEHLLKSGEVDLMLTFNARLQAAITAGMPVGFSWYQHIRGYNSWAILKGTPNADACREFIKFASDPKRQALLAPYAIGPTQPDAFKYIDSKHARFLPTYPDNFKNGLFMDASYWFKNKNTALERFNDWLLK